MATLRVHRDKRLAGGTMSEWRPGSSAELFGAILEDLDDTLQCAERNLENGHVGSAEECVAHARRVVAQALHA